MQKVRHIKQIIISTKITGKEITTGRKKIKSIIDPKVEIEPWVSLSDLIKAKNWPEWPLKRWKFPFEYEGWLVEKKDING